MRETSRAGYDLNASRRSVVDGLLASGWVWKVQGLSGWDTAQGPPESGSPALVLHLSPTYRLTLVSAPAESNSSDPPISRVLGLRALSRRITPPGTVRRGICL